MHRSVELKKQVLQHLKGPAGKKGHQEHGKTCPQEQHFLGSPCSASKAAFPSQFLSLPAAQLNNPLQKGGAMSSLEEFQPSVSQYALQPFPYRMVCLF